MEEHRKSFMLYLREEVFLRLALMRVKCEIAGYFSDNMGIAEHKDENDKKTNIFFHTDGVQEGHPRVWKARHTDSPGWMSNVSGCSTSSQ